MTDSWSATVTSVRLPQIAEVTEISKPVDDAIVGPQSIVLDAEALSALASGERRMQPWAEVARRTDSIFYASAATLVGITDGSSRDARIRQVAKLVRLVDVDDAIGYRARRIACRSRTPSQEATRHHGRRDRRRHRVRPRGTCRRGHVRPGRSRAVAHRHRRAGAHLARGSEVFDPWVTRMRHSAGGNRVEHLAGADGPLWSTTPSSVAAPREIEATSPLPRCYCS